MIKLKQYLLTIIVTLGLFTNLSNNIIQVHASGVNATNETMESGHTHVSQVEMQEHLEKTLAYLVERVPNPTFGTGGGEWTILSLARAEYAVPQGYYDIYYQNVVNEVNRLMTAGKLDSNKGSEHSRLILGLTAIKKDITNVGYNPNTESGYNILEPMADFKYMTRQGLNGPIFALISLNTIWCIALSLLYHPPLWQA